MSNPIKPISTTLLRRGIHSPLGKRAMRLGAFAPVDTASHVGKSLRPHQASDPQPLASSPPGRTAPKGLRRRSAAYAAAAQTKARTQSVPVVDDLRSSLLSED
ncbi:MAG: hypothetical protein AAFY50_12605 [Cyanobacteria bacterium J06648_1]